MKSTINVPEEYIQYHVNSLALQDVDPSYPMLQYVCDRFELTTSQRLWLAFLYASCYCAPTVFYIYNEFPDFENVDIGRLTRWWKENKQKCLFQTDRRRIQSNDQFIPSFVSYKNIIGNYTQEAVFQKIAIDFSPEINYNKLYNNFINVKYFGRYTMFLYLESVNWVTNICKFSPDRLDWGNAGSCLLGLTRAFGIQDDEAVYHVKSGHADNLLKTVQLILEQNYPSARRDIWAIETTLCAYKKFKEDRRHIGYYVHRQLEEIERMERAVPEGVCWQVLYDFRKEYFKPWSLEVAVCTK